MTIESQFDVPFVAAMALKEKQIQQTYRPIIAVHNGLHAAQERSFVDWCSQNSASCRLPRHSLVPMTFQAGLSLTPLWEAEPR